MLVCEQIEINVGTPPRTYTLLFRPDVLRSSYNHITLHTPSALLSTSVNCTSMTGETLRCTDSAIVTSSSNRHARRLVRISYGYGDAALSDSKSIRMGFDGEITTCVNCSLFLLGGELCVSSTHLITPTMLGLSLTSVTDPNLTPPSNRLVTDANHIRMAGLPWSTSAAALPCTATSDVYFMPASLYTVCRDLCRSCEQESQALNFDTTNVQELAGVDVLAGMRATMEAGTTCANQQQNLYSHANTYMARCVGMTGDRSACVTTPALTFHNVYAYRLLLDCESTSCVAYASADATLESLPDRDDQSGSVTEAVMRLLLMLLAATIVWIRSSDANASVDTLLKHMLEYAILCGCDGTATEKVTINKLDVVIDTRTVILGGLACASRLLVVLLRKADFTADGLGSVYQIELVATIASVIHWMAHVIDHVVLRLNVLDEKYPNRCFNAFVKNYACHMWRGDALATLGGSAATIDVSCATILAFTETPLRSGNHKFDSVARLLTAVLIALTGICRCLFSITLTGVVGQHDSSTVGRLTAIAGATYWGIQMVAVSSCICILFVTPLSVHVTRRSPGDTTWMALTILSFVVTLAGPRITANSLGLTQLYRSKVRST